MGTACATEPQGPRWAGQAARGFGLRPCHEANRINPGIGARAVSSAQSPNCPGIPRGPFEVAAHAPFPSLPCLQKLSGFSHLFIFHTIPWPQFPLPAPPRHSWASRTFIVPNSDSVAILQTPLPPTPAPPPEPAAHPLCLHDLAPQGTAHKWNPTELSFAADSSLSTVTSRSITKVSGVSGSTPCSLNPNPNPNPKC